MSLAIPQPKERKLFLSQQVTQESMLALTKAVLEINEDDERLSKITKIYGFKYKPKPIKIFIDTYGGALYQCFGFLSVMDNSKTPIHTIVTGCAMSCGFMISIHGHQRFCYENSTLLYHQLSGGTIGKMAEMEERVNQSKKLQKNLEKMVVSKTKISKQRLSDSYKQKEDWYISSKEALELGCVDEIIRP